MEVMFFLAELHLTAEDVFKAAGGRPEVQLRRPTVSGATT